MHNRVSSSCVARRKLKLTGKYGAGELVYFYCNVGRRVRLKKENRTLGMRIPASSWGIGEDEFVTAAVYRTIMRQRSRRSEAMCGAHLHVRRRGRRARSSLMRARHRQERASRRASVATRLPTQNGLGGKEWPRPCLGPATGGHYRHRCRSFSNFINRRPIAGAIARRIDEKQQRLRAKRIPTGESHPRIRCKYLNELVLFFCCLQLTLSLSRGCPRGREHCGMCCRVLPVVW